MERTACLRGKLPFHLLDAIALATALAEGEGGEGLDPVEQVKEQMAVPFADRQEMGKGEEVVN